MGASFGLIQVVVTVKNLFGRSSDLVIKKLLRKKLESVLVSARISLLVRLLQGKHENQKKKNYKMKKKEF